MAGLAKLRTKFVSKVSKEIVNQLLDNLLEDKVINSGERESIIEEHQTTADKARQTIDTVIKKGNKASNRLIHHLQNCDPTLHEDLSTQESQVLQEFSSTLIKSKETFWKEKQNNKDIYPVTLNSSKNRVALLITNITFADKMKNRAGAEKDEENMEKLLTDLGYEVVKYRDLTAKQMDKALVQFSNHSKLKETDSVFVVIMSHGKLGVVLGVNFKKDPSPGEEPDELPINNIYKHLNAKNCPELVNKPKIIVIQACRGEDGGSVIVCDSVDDESAMEEDIEEDKVQRIHKEKDFIALLSSTPDTVSYRHKLEGSFLMKFTIEVFNTFAHIYDVEELFRKVMGRFEDSSHPFRQMPTKDRCTLTRKFYLYPGLNHMS
uniref:Uncharacterized protein n=1 Tax=Periophthalmus magnuspinnatus TaxID=409849 RepID=A0A3B4AJ31_9GOBI